MRGGAGGFVEVLPAQVIVLDGRGDHAQHAHHTHAGNEARCIAGAEEIGLDGWGWTSLNGHGKSPVVYRLQKSPTDPCQFKSATLHHNADLSDDLHKIN